jgi:acetoin utilization protein AcuB
MKKKVETIDAERSAEEAWNRMLMGKIHHLIVTRGAEVVGVLSARDMGGPGDSAYRQGRSVADVMTRSVVTAKKETTLREAANLMRGRTIGSLPVVEDGKLVGIVTTTDLLTLIGKGAERPVTKSKRWVLKGRGARGKSGPPR